MLRRLRSALILATVWALVWLAVGLFAGLLMGWYHLPPDPVLVGIWPLLGAFSGGTFALLLAVAEKQRRLAQLSTRRVAAWGAIGGVLIPIIASFVVLALTDLHLASNAPVVFLLLGILGSSSALGTLWMAQRGSAEVDTLAPPT